MSKRLVINPVTRISGFLEIDATVEDNIVTDAHTKGLLFRGFEKMLTGRSPFDAVYFTQRICGICSSAHAMASTMALEDAMNIEVSDQGKYLRDIIHGCEYLQNHIRHFYQYTLPDYVAMPQNNTLLNAKQTDLRLPKIKNDLLVQHYFDSLDISRSAHEMLAVLGGKAPHNHGIFIGGITTQATKEKISRLFSLLHNITEFIDSKMIPDAQTIAQYYRDYFEMGEGCGNFLSYGCFNNYSQLGTLYLNPFVYHDGVKQVLAPERITENIATSWYTDQTETYAPNETIAEPDLAKSQAYSWVKAPRYNDLPYESGPLARMWLSGDYRHGISAMDRTIARVLEAKKIAGIIKVLLSNLIPGTDVQQVYSVPSAALGKGLIDTTRGALGHWLKIENQLISFYQIIAPSTWNLSTRTEDNLPGPGEKALIGTQITDPANPVELGRIIRSFDPCISCATHIYQGGNLVNSIQIVS